MRVRSYESTMTSRFRAEQVGSLLRPPELLAARSAHAAGQISLEQLRAAEDRAILAAIEKQRAIGLDVLSDGEMRRGSWLTDMADAVEGFVPEKVTLEWKGPGGGADVQRVTRRDQYLAHLVRRKNLTRRGVSMHFFLDFRLEELYI